MYATVVCHIIISSFIRLAEFSETPSSRLTLDEFLTIDLEEEQDPPAFKNARKKLQQEVIYNLISFIL